MTAPCLITCLGVDHDLPLLPHFLDHYTGLGVAPAAIVVILNAATPEAAGLARAREILADHGVGTVETWIAPYTSETMWAKRREVQAAHVGPDQWVISADIDEFHAYPEPLGDFLTRAGAMGVDCIQGVFIDRLAPGGALATVAHTPPVLEQFPIQADVIWSLAGAHGYDRRGTVKIMAMKGRVLPGRGGHRPQAGQKVTHFYGYPLGDFPGIDRPDFRFAVPTRVHHVHWTDTLPERLRIRLATPGVSKAGAAYGRIQLDHFASHGGIALDRVVQRPPKGAADWLATLRRLRRQGALRRWSAPVKALLKTDKRPNTSRKATGESARRQTGRPSHCKKRK